MAATVTALPDGTLVVENSGLDGNGNALPSLRYEFGQSGNVQHYSEASGGFGHYLTTRAGSNGWEFTSHGSLPDGTKIPLGPDGHLLLTED